MIADFVPILTLADGTYRRSGHHQVVAWDGARPTVGEIRLQSAQDHDVLCVGLDDGSDLVVTPDQRLLLRSGNPVRADELCGGESLLPFYTRMAGARLEYLDPGDWHKGGLVAADRRRWRPLARLVAEAMLNRRLQQDEVVRLRRPGLDHRPENIEIAIKSTRHKKRFDPLGKALAEAMKFMETHRHNHKVASVSTGHCFAAGSKIYTIDRSVVTPISIDVYAAEGNWRPILGYDEKKQIIRKVNVTNAWLTKKAAPVLKIGFSNGAVLRVTPEHKVLTVDRGYVEARSLVMNDRVISAIAGFSLRGQSMLTSHSPGTAWVVDPPRPDMSQPYRVYDVTTETGNLIVDGVACHNSTKCLSTAGLTSDTFVAGGVFLLADGRQWESATT